MSKLNTQSGHASERRSNLPISSDLLRRLVNIFFLFKVIWTVIAVENVTNLMYVQQMEDDLEFVIRLALEQVLAVTFTLSCESFANP